MTRKMKDSGIEWIGEIPEDWEIVKLGNISDISTGNTPRDTNNIKFSTSEGIDWIKTDNLLGVFGVSDSALKIKFDYLSEARIAEKGSVLVTCIGDIGKLGYVTTSTAFNQQINAVFFNKEVTYWKYGMYSLFAQSEQQASYANGNVLRILNRENQKKVVIAIPKDINKQKDISEFLDNKSLTIKKIISENKQSIEELKKYKQSLITEAVTKGLDPNVEMKDSEIQWIEKIPTHWNERRLKYLFQIIDDRNTDPDAELLSLYTSLGVKPRAELEERGNKAQTRLNYKIVKKGDLVVNKLLAWMGSIAFSDYEGVTSPDYDVYRILNDEITNLEFYNYYFRHTNFKDDCYKVGRGIMLMRWRTYPEQLLRLFVPLPPLREQQQIVTYLDEQTSRIDKLIEDKTKVIEELENYKKSLIYEYVTGKKEV